MIIFHHIFSPHTMPFEPFTYCIQRVIMLSQKLPLSPPDCQVIRGLIAPFSICSHRCSLVRNFLSYSLIVRMGRVNTNRTSINLVIKVILLILFDKSLENFFNGPLKNRQKSFKWVFFYIRQ